MVSNKGNTCSTRKGSQEKLGRLHVKFVHKNFTQIDLKEFDGFYFYNPFLKSIPGTEKIDDSIAYSPEFISLLQSLLIPPAEEMPAGTRVASYCSWGDEIPPGYRLVETDIDNLLKFGKTTLNRGICSGPNYLIHLKTTAGSNSAGTCSPALIVGIVALPLAIAFGIASGVSPEKGLFTAVIGGFIISALGGSRVSNRRSHRRLYRDRIWHCTASTG